MGLKVIQGFKCNDAGVAQAALDVLCTLMQVEQDVLTELLLTLCQPMHDNYEIMQEKENKTILLASKCGC